ncbi:protein SPT2 homolog [Limulus polyphemus]|uniref:Protein SPT2 homolog n=1 Tax=Limulus polyphemus TaxID=6850 RepID=A0ABM1B6U5_LIMPO|nr:protein SPT2 homolog [Limulus polyphemus]
MDFSYLMEIAQKNEEIAKESSQVKRYSTEIRPLKKQPKSLVQSTAVKKWLQRKEVEEQQKLVEAQKKKEHLLSLRAQNSKNNKKAKIMASRTKDNDFSRIKLTEDEVEAKVKRERELQQQMLTDKVERMKLRISLEERDNQAPRKRKRKSKNPELDDIEDPSSLPLDIDDNGKKSKKSCLKERRPEIEYKFNGGSEPVPAGAKPLRKSEVSTNKPKPRPFPAPAINFHDLLKIASQKQHEPIQILHPITKKEDRPMTRAEKEEEMRKKGYTLPPSSSRQVKKKRGQAQNQVTDYANDTEDYAESDVPVNQHDEFSSNMDRNYYQSETELPSQTGKCRNIVGRERQNLPDRIHCVKENSKSSEKQTIAGYRLQPYEENYRHKWRPSETGRNGDPTNNRADSLLPGLKKTLNLQADRQHQQSSGHLKNKPSNSNFSRKPNSSHRDPRGDLTHHAAPSRNPISQQIESDDEDQDLSDFIDDDPQEDEGDYSSIIRKMFGYNKQKYAHMDDDDDDMEASYVDIMKEEKRSAKIGMMEDLEDIRREEEERKKMLLKKKLQKQK